MTTGPLLLVYPCVNQTCLFCTNFNRVVITGYRELIAVREVICNCVAIREVIDIREVIAITEVITIKK